MCYNVDIKILRYKYMPAKGDFKYNKEQILKISERYFRKCEKDGEPLTVTGLAIALGTTRKMMMEWEKREDLGNTIKKIKARVEHYVEKMTISGKIAPAVGIFVLKNFDWTDKKVIDQNITGEVSLGKAFDVKE